MSSVQHTAGPWEWVRVLIDEERPDHYLSLSHPLASETDKAVIDLDEDEHGCMRMLIENPADAALIVASPDLLAALEELAGHLTPIGWCWCPWESVDNYHTARCRTATAAVAKAKGAQP